MVDWVNRGGGHARKYACSLSTPWTTVDPLTPDWYMCPDRFHCHHFDAFCGHIFADLDAGWATLRKDWGDSSTDEEGALLLSKLIIAKFAAGNLSSWHHPSSTCSRVESFVFQSSLYEWLPYDIHFRSQIYAFAARVKSLILQQALWAVARVLCHWKIRHWWICCTCEIFHIKIVMVRSAACT